MKDDFYDGVIVKSLVANYLYVLQSPINNECLDFIVCLFIEFFIIKL